MLTDRKRALLAAVTLAVCVVCVSLSSFALPSSFSHSASLQAREQGAADLAVTSSLLSVSSSSLSSSPVFLLERERETDIRGAGQDEQSFQDEKDGAFSDITGNRARIVDPALLRLSNDPYFTTETDLSLAEAAEKVSQHMLARIIKSRVERMQERERQNRRWSPSSSPLFHVDQDEQEDSEDLEKLTRVVEEQLIYDKYTLSHVQKAVERRISPAMREGQGEMKEVRTLEEKLKAKIMYSMLKEAVREINLLVDASEESPNVKLMTKDHLLERTTQILAPQVEGRVKRFILSRVSLGAKTGLKKVLLILAQSVNEEEKRELLGGPLVDGVDYSFQQKQREEEAAAAAAHEGEKKEGPNAGEESKKISRKSALALKTLLPEASSGEASAAGSASASAASGSSAASAGGSSGAASGSGSGSAEGAAEGGFGKRISEEPVGAETIEPENVEQGTGVNLGLVLFVVALFGVIALIAFL